MNKKIGTEKLNRKTVFKVIGNSYKFIAYLAIIAVLALINYFHIFNNNNIVGGIIGIIIGSLFFIIVNKFIINKLQDKTLKTITNVLLILFGVLTYLSVYYFRIRYRWDFYTVLESAKQLAKRGIINDIWYFKMFPNNWGCLMIMALSIKLFFGSEVGIFVINIFSICMAAVFSVLSARKIGGHKLALNVIILLIGCIPLYLYAPVVYTDTLSVAFPVATLYFWLLAKECKEDSPFDYYVNLILMTLMGVFGYCIKPVAAIVLVAVVLEKIFTSINMGTLKSIVVVFTISIVVISGFNKVGEALIIYDTRKNDLEMPLTHWVMMGLSKPPEEGGDSLGYGANSPSDVALTRESEKFEEKRETNIKEIKNRLVNYGFTGYVDFLLKKFNYTWNDATYSVYNVIGDTTLNKSSIPYKYVIGEESDKYVKPYINHFNDVLFLVMLVGLIVEVAKKEKDETMRVLGTSVVGIAIFLLIWETRSRYVYFMLPVFCMLGAYGVLNITNNIENIIQKLKKKTPEQIKLLKK